jgi:glycosyltransferase involved in cell wall biosynthesis
MPSLSIIIPTYNSEKLIERCLLSIVGQDFNNYEIIIQDGLSTDKTVCEVEKVKKKYLHADIKLYSEKDTGVYDAMNKAVQKAKGEWFYFLGSDDYLLNKYVLSDVYSSIINEYGKCKVFYGNVISPAFGEKYDGEFDIDKILVKNICHQAIFYNKKVFERVGFYNLRYKILADYEFNLRCFFHRKLEFVYIDKMIAYFSAGGLCNSNRDESFYLDYPDKASLVKKIAYRKMPLKILKSYFGSRFELLKFLFRHFVIRLG